ncbi:MAG: diacylglycerol kinase family lipid kinase [Chloroflexi bacterium]|nr:diacylglycerol kinase family lipid kinase [Chloroflexota bacterium]
MTHMRAALVFNPIAGIAGRGRAAQVVQWAQKALQALGWSVVLKETRRHGEMHGVAASVLSEDVDAVFAAGGDGTVGAVSAALAGSDVVMGVLPTGTANIWAVELGLIEPGAGLKSAADVQNCLEAQLNGVVRSVDIGRCGDRSFLLWAGVGLDGHVISKIEPRPELSKRLGEAYFYLAGLLAAADFRGGPMTVRADDRTISGTKLLAVITNIRRYAGVQSILDPDTRVDDGQLDVWTMDGESYFEALGQLVRYKRGQHLGHPTVQKLSGRRIEVETELPMRLQFDGEAAEAVKRAEFNVWPAALRVFAPQKPSPIFSNRPGDADALRADFRG